MKTSFNLVIFISISPFCNCEELCSEAVLKIDCVAIAQNNTYSLGAGPKINVALVPPNPKEFDIA